MNKYASPHVELDIALVKYTNGHEFLAIQAKEFLDTPLVCKKNGPTGEGIVQGGVYVRPPGVARTTRVVDAAQMHDLLELAAEKRARDILQISRRIGLVAKPVTSEQFDQELEGL